MKRLVAFAVAAVCLSGCSGRSAQDRRIAHLKAQARLGTTAKPLTCQEAAERDHKACLASSEEARKTEAGKIANVLFRRGERDYEADLREDQARRDSACHAKFQVQATSCSAPVQAAAPAPPPADDMVTKLERLGALREKGLLTEQEFAAQKAQLLGSPASPAAAPPEAPTQTATPTP